MPTRRGWKEKSPGGGAEGSGTSFETIGELFRHATGYRVASSYLQIEWNGVSVRSMPIVDNWPVRDLRPPTRMGGRR
jgi:hypothetical protein